MVDLDDAATAFLTASRALVGVIAQSVAPALDKITVPQFRVLVVLSNSDAPMRSGDLAAALGVQPSTFTRTADRMVTAGWITRVENPKNRREHLVALTASGRRLVAQVTRRREKEIKKILASLDDRQIKSVLTAMETFSEAAREPKPHALSSLGF